MAECLLKVGTVGPPPAYQDGDIVIAINDRRISQVHCERIARDDATFRSDGRRHEASLFRFFLEKTVRYRFERVSATEVNRVEIGTGTSVRLGTTPVELDGLLQRLDVRQFVRRRLSHPRHAIFGSPDREFWFGGEKDFSVQKLNEVWFEIENRTGQRQEDFPLWPLTVTELRHFFAVSVDDFDDATSADLASEHTDENEKLLFKRRHFMDWRRLLNEDRRFSGARESDIEGLQRDVDLRGASRRVVRDAALRQRV